MITDQERAALKAAGVRVGSPAGDRELARLRKEANSRASVKRFPVPQSWINDEEDSVYDQSEDSQIEPVEEEDGRASQSDSGDEGLSGHGLEF
jgi:hypothetical protein